MRTGKERFLREGRTSSLAFSPDGHVLATCGDDGVVVLWSASDGELLGTSEGK